MIEQYISLRFQYFNRRVLREVKFDRNLFLKLTGKKSKILTVFERIRNFYHFI